MPALTHYAPWLGWLALLVGALLIFRWRKYLRTHHVQAYSILSVGVGCIFVHDLLTRRQSVMTIVDGIWLFFALLALWSSINFRSEESSQ